MQFDVVCRTQYIPRTVEAYYQKYSIILRRKSQEKALNVEVFKAFLPYLEKRSRFRRNIPSNERERHCDLSEILCFCL